MKPRSPPTYLHTGIEKVLYMLKIRGRCSQKLSAQPLLWGRGKRKRSVLGGRCKRCKVNSKLATVWHFIEKLISIIMRNQTQRDTDLSYCCIYTNTFTFCESENPLSCLLKYSVKVILFLKEVKFSNSIQLSTKIQFSSILLLEIPVMLQFFIY